MSLSRLGMAAGLAALLLLALGVLSIPASASPLVQGTPFPTPTPGLDGRILYTVLPGDSPFLIAAKFQIDINQLNILNNWTSDVVLQEGQTVILGLATTPEATEGLTPTPGVEATPEDQGTGIICVLLFEDVNGDAERQSTEFAVPDGAVSVTERTGLASATQSTIFNFDDEGEPIATCFENLPAGEYTISVAAPDGYNATTVQSATIDLVPGSATRLNFGAQLSSEAQADQLSPEEGGRSPLMGLLGFVLLLAGLGLGYYNFQNRRGRRGLS